MATLETIRFKTGFTYKGLSYGWHNGILCKFPYTNKQRSHKISRVPIIKIHKKEGYCLGGCRKSKTQANKMTEEINYEYKYYKKTIL